MHKRKEPLPLRKKLLSDHVGDLYTALLIAGGLLLLIMAVLPSSVQNVTALMLFPVLLLGIGVAYFAFVHASHPTVTGGILAMASVANLLQATLLSTPRLTMLLSAVLLIAHTAYCARYFLLSAYLPYRPILNGGLILYESLMTVSGMSSYTYVEKPAFMHFWELPLLLSLLLTGVTVYFLAKGHIYLRDNRLSERIALPFLVLLFSFVLMTGTIGNLNRALDTSAPTAYTVTVKDKHKTGGENTDYYLTVMVEGREMDMDVSGTTYRETEIGAPMTVEVYEGAFGKAYCVIRHIP